ncbi:MAG: phosphoribosylamine--glycine ligase [Candidatus Omnitrophota bacterium]
MNVLVIGSGGREHAICWKIKQSPKVRTIYCAPGNGGISEAASCVDIKADDIAGLLKFAKDKKIDLTVVGPEVPLVAGIVDEFEKNGLKVFGPQKGAAQLEGSKIFAKEFMKRNKIPTADFENFDSLVRAEQIAAQGKFRFPLVIKADGLAAGKGVVICQSLDDVKQALKTAVKKNGVIEEYLDGEEASILAISDGKNFVLLESSQDHKRTFDNDQGPNTGGMGAYSPAPVVTPELMKKISKEVIKPVIDGMSREGNPFKGVLYAGLMINKNELKVLEFNVRFGDPETQAVLPRLKTDLVDVMLASCDDTLDKINLQWDKRVCACVVMASKGYPDNYEKGKEIKGLDASSEKDAIVFHAGTVEQHDKILTSGGRVLGVVGLGKDIKEAVGKSYKKVSQIKFDGCHFRKDIGFRALKRPS